MEIIPLIIMMMMMMMIMIMIMIMIIIIMFILGAHSPTVVVFSGALLSVWQ